MNPSPATIRRILVPHDFSDAADHALSYALDLARALQASVVVMHAFEVPAFAFPEGAIVTTNLLQQVQRAAQAALDGVLKRAERPGVPVTSVLRQGPTWSEINAAAEE